MTMTSRPNLPRAEPSPQSKGEVFERRVGGLFALLGYRVDYDVLIGGRQVDLLIEDKSGPLVRTYIVECKDLERPVSTAQYDSFSGRLRVARQELGPKVRGILVSRAGFVKEARAQSERDDIELLTLSELETSVIDFRPYVSDLLDQLERDEHLDYFVEPRAQRETASLDEPFFELFEEWLRNPEQNQLTLLGDYGTGKTTLLRRIAFDLTRQHRDAALAGVYDARVPIYIDLRDYTHALSLKQIVLDFMDHHGVRAASYAAFEHVLAAGRALLLLDGFDEMASRGNYRVTLRNFRELNRHVLGRSKIVLSCRTHYFASEREVHRFHGHAGDSFLPRSYTDLYRDIAAKPNFQIVHLQEFSDRQIENYLQRRCGERWQSVRAFIEQTYNLAELSRRPVLLDMIVASEKRLGRHRATVSPGLLYQVYTDIWLNTNDWSTVIDIAAKAELLEAVARHADRGEGDGVAYRDLPGLIEGQQPHLDPPTAIEVDRDLRTASFLVRDGEGRYRFSHQSFQEFFLARALLRDAERGEIEQWRAAAFPTEIYRFLRDLLPDRPRAIASLLTWLSEPVLENHDSLAHIRTNAAKCLGGVLDESVATALTQTLAHDSAARARQAAASALAGFSGESVDRQLIESARSDPGRFVRANCVMALARSRTDLARDFLLGVLNGDEPSVGADDRMLWPIYHAAREWGDPALVAACVARAPRTLSGRSAKELAAVCLSLCLAHPGDSCRAYAEHVFETTGSSRLAGLAFDVLPLEARRERAPELIERFHQLHRQERRHPHLALLLTSLSGLDLDVVCQLLTDLLSRTDDLQVAAAALEVMDADYPRAVLDAAPSWLGHGRPHAIKRLVAEHLASREPTAAVPALVELLGPRERLVTRLTVLRLLAEIDLDRLALEIEGRWAEEKAPRLQRAAAEWLLRQDRRRARALLLKGLEASRRSTRRVACMVLGSLTEGDVTAALMRSLASDPAPTVRQQALRSLCAPGREVDRRAIAEAAGHQATPELLALRDELLGRLAAAR